MESRRKPVSIDPVTAPESANPVLAELLDARTVEQLRAFFDPAWYLEKYPDLASIGLDPLTHYILYGAAEGRDPNRFFDSAWYTRRYPDVLTSEYPPLLHYLLWGAAELRNPSQRFDAAYYVDMHPEAAVNPLLHHMRIGAGRGWATEPKIDIGDFLPSSALPASCPDGLVVDVIVAAYRGLQQTQHCLNSVLADPDRPPGEVIVVEDCSPEPKLRAWLRTLARAGAITLLRNARNLGFVASVNRGMQAAGTHDVALLNSDTVVPHGWLRRLAAQAYAVPRVASVSPFSNNATICGYPSVSGVSEAFGLDVHRIDAACRVVNVGRHVEIPTTVGSCMYIRRAALNDVGQFDHKTFGHGYGEENDFCLRAAVRGWRHMLACDTYVFHEGNVSFGTDAARQKQRNLGALVARYPDYARLIDRHVRRDAAGPARFALTAALLRGSGKPSVLMVSHQLGGGVKRHIDELVGRLGEMVNVLLLSSSARGVGLSVPALPGHSILTLTGDRLDDLVAYLSTTKLHRVHVHHVAELDLDLHALVQRMGLGFDLTVHDYFAICPQVNLLPEPQLAYCGEPGPAGCNACIAKRPSYGAREILSWRRTHARLLLEAERVLCPSEDVHARLVRHGLARDAIVAPHEPVTEPLWIVRPPPLSAGKPLRIALIGVLAPHKGESSVVQLAEAAPSNEISLHLIGHAERDLPRGVAGRISVTGAYEEADRAGLLSSSKPHVVWFPAHWPETYSYTLSVAIEARLPIVATRIGAFPERLEGRPLTWLVDPAATTQTWLAVFREVRAALRPKTPGTLIATSAAPSSSASVSAKRSTRRPSLAALSVAPPAAMRRPVVDFYAHDYAAPLQAPAIRRREIDLRQPGHASVAVIPERLQNGALSPCAYIRLLQPLDHLACAGEMAEKTQTGQLGAINLVIADAHEMARLRVDIVATQRYAVTDIATADALAARCRETGARLLYDIDDNLLDIPRDHPEAAMLRPRARTVARMLRQADTVWASTTPLAEALRQTRSVARPAIKVMANALDERLWGRLTAPPSSHTQPVRLLFMGSATHGGDWAIVAPAMGRIFATFGARVTFDMIGVVGAVELPHWVNRISPSSSGMASYPGFVNWITQLAPWDIGIAPLADTAFNRAKSAIKALDYAALGLAVLASDVPAYRGAFANGACGRLVANTPSAWFRALSDLVLDAPSRRTLAAGARAAVTAHHTLAAQAATRRAAWLNLLPPTKTRAATAALRRRSA
jgi:GT2 family glycosyltransferase/glycosyltransferase involved in cell wall biosynthesis